MSIFKKLFLSLLLSTTILTFVEGGLRFFDIPAKGIYEGDPATLWTIRPNLNQSIPHSEAPFYVQTNIHGFRGAAVEKEAWLALGCSTTFGWGVEEKDTWVQQLSALVETPIINGGVPGWSTHQAVQGVSKWSVFQPKVVLVSYIVRDAQLSNHADKDAVPSPIWSQMQMFRLIQQGIRKPSAKGTIARVNPDDYRRNLTRIRSAFPKAEIVFFPFPQQEEASEWVSVLKEFSSLELPKMDSADFFATDPIHLNKDGNYRFARILKSSLVDASILSPQH